MQISIRRIAAILGLGMSMLLIACGKTADVPAEPLQSDTAEARPRELPDGQPYAEFQADGFSFRYPDWPHAGTGSVSSPDDTVAIAVETAGCTFMLNVLPIPEGETFEEFTRSRLGAQKDAVSNIKITASDITPERAFIDSEVALEYENVRAISHVFPARGRSYGLGFISPGLLFDIVCRPFMEETVAPVQID